MSWSHYRLLWWFAGQGAVAYGALILAARPSLADVLLIGRGLAAQVALFRWLVSSPATCRGAMPDVSASATAQLCRLWPVTHRAMQRIQDPAARQVLVRLRAECLDELERRHPDRFLHWLAEARADGDPEPFLCPPTAERLGE